MPFIPESVKSQRSGGMDVEQPKRKTERDLELEMGRDYKIDLRSKQSFNVAQALALF